MHLRLQYAYDCKLYTFCMRTSLKISLDHYIHVVHYLTACRLHKCVRSNELELALSYHICFRVSSTASSVALSLLMTTR